MSETTMSTLVRIIIVLLVIGIVTISLFMLWKNFVKPSFSGLGTDQGILPGIALLMYGKKVLKTTENSGKDIQKREHE